MLMLPRAQMFLGCAIRSRGSEKAGAAATAKHKRGRARQERFSFPLDSGISMNNLTDHPGRFFFLLSTAVWMSMGHTGVAQTPPAHPSRGDELLH